MAAKSPAVVGRGSPTCCVPDRAPHLARVLCPRLHATRGGSCATLLHAATPAWRCPGLICRAPCRPAPDGQGREFACAACAYSAAALCVTRMVSNSAGCAGVRALQPGDTDPLNMPGTTTEPVRGLGTALRFHLSHPVRRLLPVPAQVFAPARRRIGRHPRKYAEVAGSS